jgi:hypothetical protein
LSEPYASWNAERSFADLTHRNERNKEKISPYLVDWNDLPEDIHDYDRQTARKISLALTLLECEATNELDNGS